MAWCVLALLFPQEAEIPRLIEALGAEFLEERVEARTRLDKVAREAEPLLIEALRSPDFRIRRACLEILAGIPSSSARERAAELFRKDADPSVREGAFRLLCRLGLGAEDDLIAALESPDPDHRRAALRALGDAGSRKCAAAVFDLHEREDEPDLKEGAFEYLKSLGTEAEPWLLRFIASPEAEQCLGALEALRGLRSGEVLKEAGRAFLSATDEAIIDGIAAYLSAVAGPARGLLIEGLGSVRERTRLRSVQALGSFGEEEVIPAVGKLLGNDPSEEVRKAAAEYVGSRGPAGDPFLAEGLSSPDRTARLLTLRTLKSFPREGFLGKLAGIFREEGDAEIHRAAFDAFRPLGAPAEEALCGALSDADGSIRVEAVQTLGLLKSELAVDTLVEFLGGAHDGIRAAAGEALARIGAKGVEAVGRAETEGRVGPDVAVGVRRLYREEWVEGLLRRKGEAGYYEGMFAELLEFGGDEAVPALLRIALDPGYPFRGMEGGLREMAILALGELARPEALEPLREALKVSGPLDKGVSRSDLVVALYKLGDRGPSEEFVAAGNALVEESFGKDGNREEGCRILFAVGLVQKRTGNLEGAEAFFLRILQEPEGKYFPVAVYNLACVSAIRGEKAQAVERLAQAVRAGFNYRDWIGQDGDLRSIREEEGYRRLLADDALFGTGDGD